MSALRRCPEEPGGNRSDQAEHADGCGPNKGDRDAVRKLEGQLKAIGDNQSCGYEEIEPQEHDEIGAEPFSKGNERPLIFIEKRCLVYFKAKHILKVFKIGLRVSLNPCESRADNAQARWSIARDGRCRVRRGLRRGHRNSLG